MDDLQIWIIDSFWSSFSLRKTYNMYIFDHGQLNFANVEVSMSYICVYVTCTTISPYKASIHGVRHIISRQMTYDQ